MIRPALQIFHTRPEVHKAAGAYLIILRDKVYIFSDATVNIDPSAEDLAEIALLAADLAERLGLIQVRDASSLETWVDEVLAAHPAGQPKPRGGPEPSR